ncbi:hypothetical protein XENTR_v10001335 [Xenopus tropicalis]|nr:hypothetical protein XENTR_v10001335 [Xenopus tropicalis]
MMVIHVYTQLQNHWNEVEKNLFTFHLFINSVVPNVRIFFSPFPQCDDFLEMWGSDEAFPSHSIFLDADLTYRLLCESSSQILVVRSSSAC